MVYAFFAACFACLWDFCDGVVRYWDRSTSSEILADFVISMGALIVIFLVLNGERMASFLR